MQVHILYTGGTIGMERMPEGLAPGADLEGWLAGRVAPTLPDGIVLSYDELPRLIDSSNATPESWQEIADALHAAQHGTGADAFVVLHGTDTMAYASAALSYALAGFGSPVVLTGSQLPLGAVGSDAAANVAGALQAAADPRAAGISLFFGGRLFRGNRVTKDSSWSFDAYRSPNAPELARAGAPWRWNDRAAARKAVPGRGWADPLPYTRHDIAVVDFAPGITATRVAATLTPLPEAVILRSYGTGNVPVAEAGLVSELERAAGEGVPLVVCSQCPQARVELGRYETGSALARIGAVGAGDMCFEAGYAKTAFLLSQGLAGDELAGWIPRSIAGEVTETASPDRPAEAGEGDRPCSR